MAHHPFCLRRRPVDGGGGPEKIENCVIIGSGPAGHTAAVYAGRAMLEPLLYEGFMAGGVAAGGQLTTTTDVENYPGFPDGIGGPELMDLMRRQSERSGARIVTETVSQVDLGAAPYAVTTEGSGTVRARTLIIATGATAKRLDVPGAERLSSAGFPPARCATAPCRCSAASGWWWWAAATPPPRKQPS